MPRRIIIDTDVCMGSGQCSMYAENTFELGEDDLARVVDPDGDPADVIDEAAAGCPTGAIKVVEE